MRNNLPPLPTLSCLKNAGPGESSLMKTITAKNKGAKQPKAARKPIKDTLRHQRKANLTAETTRSTSASVMRV